MSLQRVPLNNFRGGLNDRDSPFELQPNESPDLLNVTISALVGALEARKGKEIVVPGFIGAGGLEVPYEKVDYAKQVVVGEQPYLMLSINGSVWALKEEPSAMLLMKLHAGTAKTVWDFELYADAAFKDWVYMGNGVDAMQKWDGASGATVEWKATVGTIPKGGVLCVWENRMFISYVTANQQRVYFSEFSDPEATIKEYGFVDVRGPEEDLDAVQDLAVMGARLIILKRRSVFFISSAVTMANRRIGSPGVYGRFQCAELENKLYFFNPEGIFSTSGVEVQMESGSITNFFPEKVVPRLLGGVRMAATRDTYPRLLLALPTEENASREVKFPDFNKTEENNVILEMVPHINFRRIGGRRYLLLPAFMLHSIPASALATFNPKGYKEELYAFSELFGMKTFVGAPADNLETGENPLNKAGNWKKFGWASTIGFVTGGGGAAWRPGTQFPETAGAYWNPAIGSAADVRMKVGFPIAPANSGGSWGIWIRANITEKSGYQWRLEPYAFNGSGEVIQQKFSLIRWDKGVATVLGTYILKAGEKVEHIALTCFKGRLVGWYNVEGGGPNVGAVEVEDWTYETGAPGMSLENFKSEGAALGLKQFQIEISAQPRAFYRLFTGETDDNVVISSRWQSAWLPVQGEEPKERVRRLNVELQGDAYVDVLEDFGTTPKFTKLLPTGAAGAYRFVRVRPETRGRFHSVRFRSNSGEVGTKRFLINAAELVVRGGKEH